MTAASARFTRNTPPRMTQLRDLPQRSRPPASRFAAQRARAAELDQLRLDRPLSEIEHAEADRLAACLYMRLWREEQAR